MKYYALIAYYFLHIQSLVSEELLGGGAEKQMPALTQADQKVLEKLTPRLDIILVFVALYSYRGYCELLFRNGGHVAAWPFFVQGLSQVKEVVVSPADLESA